MCLAAATPAAYGLSRINISTTGVAAILVIALLVTQMIPGIVIANGLFPLYNNVGLVNTIPGLILADASHGIAFCILLMRAFMQNIPQSLLEAARIDGANEIQALLQRCAAVEPERARDGCGLLIPVRLERLPVRADVDERIDLTPITLSMYIFVGAHTQSWAALHGHRALWQACRPPCSWSSRRSMSRPE